MHRLHAVLITVTCLTLGACATPVPLALGAAQVRLTKNPADMATCKPVGNIRVPEMPLGFSVDVENSERVFRNQVVGFGGNAALVTLVQLGALSQGVAYQCP